LTTTNRRTPRSGHDSTYTRTDQNAASDEQVALIRRTEDDSARDDLESGNR
jgi:hypothetical protein